MEQLVPAWTKRLTHLKEGDFEEVKQALEVLFMPYIKRYLEIYDAQGGFSSLPPFGKRGVDSPAELMSNIKTQELPFGRQDNAGSPCSWNTSEGTTSDDATSSPEEDSQCLDMTVHTPLLRSPFPVVDDLGSGTTVLEGTNEDFSMMQRLGQLFGFISW
jgi:hypothetical protein